MGNRRQSEHAALEQRRRERDPGGGALVDMRLDVEFQDQIILSVGGRWDRRLEGYDPVLEGTELGDPDGAEGRIVVVPHAGELGTLAWFLAWLVEHAKRRDNPPQLTAAEFDALDRRQCDPNEVFAALLAGGRRGGKTWTAALCCVIYALLFPGSTIWIVNPSDSKHDEVRVYFAELLAPDWISRFTTADGWELINGSALMLKSAYVGADPDAIKEGKCHLVWLNEGQKMKERVYIVARGATSDKSGLVLVCANPPVQEKDQQWVTDLAADAQAGRRMAVYHHFNPLDNPHINRLALLALRDELDDRAYRIEVLGEFLPPIDMVAYNWSRTKGGNERPAPALDDPHWQDVTELFLRIEDLGEGYTHICGIDFQVHPHIGGPVYKLYAPRGDRLPTRENVVMWAIDEIVLQGDELEWCAEAKSKDYNPRTTLIVGDGTGEYQHTRRGSLESPPPEWHGKGSFDIIRMGGFPNITRPSLRIRRNNPHVIDRCRALTSMIESASKRRRLFYDIDRCPKTAKSLREWPTVHGKPSRTHEAAHLGDAASYPIVRLFPRILRDERSNRMDPVIQRTERPDRRADSPLDTPRRGRAERGL